MTLIERAREYVSKMPTAVSGQGGHPATFAVACVLAWGFDLAESDAMALLQEYNQRCAPPWSEKDLIHKLKSVATSPHERPSGYLKGVSYVYGRSEPARPPKPSMPQHNHDLTRPCMLPAPMEDATRQLLMAAFREGEGIGIAQEVLGPDGKGQPKDQGPTLSREVWLQKLNERSGDPNRIWSTSDRTGAYIRINPLRIGGATDADVTAFRHVLIEFDSLDLDQQWNHIEQSRIPCTAVIYSGGRSLHAWVRVDAKDREEYEARRIQLYDYFGKDVDPKNKNPSRLSRLPGMVRGGNQQTLLALNIGAKEWEDWSHSSGKGLPVIRDAAEMITDIRSGKVKLPDQIVDGILHRGHKMALGGGSKTNKTWCLMDLAISMAAGADWLGHPCAQGRVLYLNFEIDDAHFAKRLQLVTEARKIELKKGWLEVWPLRGHVTPYAEMVDATLRNIKKQEYSLIVLDPLYKLLGGADENKATDITQMLNAIDGLATHSKAAVAFGAHFSKGNQAGKEAIDRISGSGVFARDPDTIMSITRHEEDGAFIIEFTTRNFPYVEPFVVRWQFPLMARDGKLDPAKFKQPNARKFTAGQFLDVLGDQSLTHAAWSEKAVSSLGCGSATFDRYRKQLSKDKVIEEVTVEGNVKGYRKAVVVQSF